MISLCPWLLGVTMAALLLLVVDRAMLRAITLCRCLLVLIMARLWLLMLGRNMLKLMTLWHFLLVLERCMLILTVPWLSFPLRGLSILTVLRLICLLEHTCNRFVLGCQLLLPP